MRLALIVDDSELNRKLERDLLRIAGFETLEAAGFAGWIEKPILVDRFADDVRRHAEPA